MSLDGVKREASGRFPSLRERMGFGRWETGSRILAVRVMPGNGAISSMIQGIKEVDLKW
jgi:hypothetical protein